MGQVLSEPVTTKNTESYQNDLFSVGCSSMQGWRPQMEDASYIQLAFHDDPDSAYFAVYDGHGSQRFSTYCSQELHKQLVADSSYATGNYEQALVNSFLFLDNKLHTDTSLNYQHEPGGTTAVAVLIKESTIFCANAGDSRAIACVHGNIQELSHDHKPLNPDEEMRIRNAGGWIECNRVNGNLALSRAIGDFSFKENKALPPEQQIITAFPDVEIFPLLEDCEFIVVACDGIWDVMSNIEVVEFVRRRIANNMSPSSICEALLDQCLAPDRRMGGLGCDNMTAILVCCLNSEPYSNLVAKCSRVTTKTTAHVKAHHSWAHRRNYKLMPESDSDDRSEEMLTFGVSPRSKLNDTVSGANTDLDSEMASSKEKSIDFTELFVTGVTRIDDDGSRTRNQSSSSSEEDVFWEEETLSIELDTGATPIETMV